MRKLTLINGNASLTEENKEKELSLLAKVEAYSDLFLKRKSTHPQEDYSKFFLIFCYNFYQCKRVRQAHEMFLQIAPQYFHDQIIVDMEKAVEHRNVADRLLRERKRAAAEKHQEEAEFFLVVIYLLPYLLKDPVLKDLTYIQAFVAKLREKTFNLQLAPRLGLVEET